LSQKFEIYMNYGRKRLEQLKNYRQIAQKVKEIVQKRLGNVEVYVFGSVIENKATASSDIDLLIITENIEKEEAQKLKAAIIESIDAPIELHITSKSSFENWYKKFITKMEKIA